MASRKESSKDVIKWKDLLKLKDQKDKLKGVGITLQLHADEDTPLIASRSKVYRAITNCDYVQKANKMRSSISKRLKHKYCGFHYDHDMILTIS